MDYITTRVVGVFLFAHCLCRSRRVPGTQWLLLQLLQFDVRRGSVATVSVRAFHAVGVAVYHAYVDHAADE